MVRHHREPPATTCRALLLLVPMVRAGNTAVTCQRLGTRTPQKLATLALSAMRDAEDVAAHAITRRWQREMPFVTRDWYQLVGPVPDVPLCAGLARTGDDACARNWTADTTSGAFAGALSVDER